LVHNGGVRGSKKLVRRSISLPENVATQVRVLARRRRLSANRLLLELIENGLEAQKRKERQFRSVAERFRAATDASELKKLGDEMGRMIFG
jgi:hypothetical protein